MRRLVLAVALLLAIAPAQAAERWSTQMQWIGIYPADRIDRRDLLATQPLAATLARLVGRERAAAVRGLAVEVPVARVGDVLVIQKCRAHACPIANAAILLDLATEGIAVCLWRRIGKERFERRWHVEGQAKPVVARLAGPVSGPDCFGDAKDVVAARDALPR